MKILEIMRKGKEAEDRELFYPLLKHARKIVGCYTFHKKIIHMGGKKTF